MSKNKLLTILIFFGTLPLFADFDLPFPKQNSKKKIPHQNVQNVLEIKVGSPIHFPKIENKNISKAEIQNTSVKSNETIDSKVKLDLSTTSEIVTAQNIENTTQIDQTQSVSNTIIPNFSRGIYISQRTLGKPKFFQELRLKAKLYGINLFVIDIQPKPPSKEELETLVTEGFYPVARVVNFDGGLLTEKPSEQRITAIHRSVRAACQSGFPEIQLDYIRYADNLQIKLSYEIRYKNISGIIQRIRNETLKCENLPYLGADIFGRIPFNQNDMIGQKVEIFAQVVDVLYPMLYPSHFYGMPNRIKDPYQTVYDGTLLTLKRSLKTTRVIPYIQGFNMAVGKSGLSLSNYIKAQIKASYEGGAHGFVVWNAWNDYESTFQALKDFDQEPKK
ncbi:putative glycoside hydrolase [Leptospira sp. WS92.C1]